MRRQLCIAPTHQVPTETYHPLSCDTSPCVPTVAVGHTRQIICQAASTPDPRAPSSIPFSATAEEKLGITFTTKDGLTLSRGSNGELRATIENESNDLGIGYVRKNGAFSTETHWTKIYDQVPGGRSSLNAVKMAGTYSLDVVHKEKGCTTLNVVMDSSVQAIKIQVGNKVYLLRESDIQELERNIKAAVQSAPARPLVPAPQSSSPSSAETTGIGNRVENQDSNSHLPSVAPVRVRPVAAVEPRASARPKANTDPRAAEPRRAKPAEPQGSKSASRPSRTTAAEPAGVSANEASARAAQTNSQPVEQNAKTGVSRRAPELPADPISERARVVPETNAPKSLRSAAPVDTQNAPTPEPASSSTSTKSGTLQTETSAAQTTKLKLNVQLKESLARFNQNIKLSDWARSNPFKAMTYAAAMSEAVTGAMKANYDPDDSHSPIPTLLALLNGDIQKGFEFTTSQGGLPAAVAAEATKSAGDAAAALTLFATLDHGVTVASTTKVGQMLGGRTAAAAFSRALGVAGIAYHGYSTFSDGSFVQQNDLQLSGSTASPIIMGAVIGAPLGPIGAGGGAVLGAGSEAVGVAVGYSRLNGEIQSDWKKREVREAILLAEQGFILPADDSRVKSRKPFEQLPIEHQEVLTDTAKLATLARLTRELPPADLAALGFLTEPATGAPESERIRVGTHNWQRMNELTEGRSGYNPYRLWAGDYLDEVKHSHPLLAQTFINSYSEAKDHYKNLYNRAPHVTFKVTDDKVTEDSELSKYIEEVVKEIPAGSTRSATLTSLEEAFPAIETIMTNKNARERLTRQLENKTGNKGRFLKLFNVVP